MNFQKEYNYLMCAAGFTQSVPVSEQEELEIQEKLKHGGTIPSDIHLEGEIHVRHEAADISAEDLQKLCALKTYLATNTIKKCVVFFTIIAVISLVLSLIALKLNPLFP